MLDARCDAYEWVGSDFELGDAIVFHSQTLHRSLPNRTDRIRLSVDYRFQREGEALTEGCLLPHFGRETWDEIYQGWARTDLQYYWLAKRYTVDPWDPTHHALPDDAFEDAIRTWMLWRRDHPQRGVPQLDQETFAKIWRDAAAQ